MRFNTISKLVFILLTININYSLAQEAFPHVENEILVRLKDDHSISWLIKDLEFHKGLRTRSQAKSLLSQHMNIWQISFNKDILTADKMLEIARKHPSVHNAQLNFILEKRVTPNDPSYNQQWQYEQASDFDLDASAAWDITTGGVTALGDTIVVCVIDDGLQVNHPDWGNNLWRNHGEIAGNGIDDDGNGYIDDFQGWNADNNNNDIVASNPFTTHGTPVAGIVAAQGNNGIGVSGVNWNVKLMFVVGGGTSANSIAAYSYPLACRKLYNQTNGASGAFVVATNASWGQDNQQCATYAPLVNEFYDTLGVYGILNAAASANANNNVDVTGDFPTSCDSDYLIAVTNMDQTGNKVVQAGYGLTHVDLGAYGEGTYTIATGSSYAGFGGTSGATPHVAGTIGLLYSAPCPRLALLARTQPAQTALMLKQIIINSTVSHSSLNGTTVSGGVLNMKNALDSVMAIGCSLSGCHEPYNLQVNSSNSSAFVNWDAVDSTHLYYLQYRLTGSPSWTSINTTDTFATINGLIACTSYEVQVASDCDTTTYSTAVSFKTGDCCLAPNSITTNNLGLSNASFSWATDSFVNTYTVEYKLKSATNWTSTSTSSPNISLSNLDSCSTYELRIIASCAVNINNQYSPTIEFETAGCGKCTSTNYCASTGQNSGDDWIENVTLGLINHTTGNNNGYASFVNGGPSTDLSQGGSYPISLGIGFNVGVWGTNWLLKVWIDYNQDEVFDNATELVYDAGQISTATNNHTGTINIPSNAVLGRTRMRVALKWGTTTLNPCDNTTYGETEDYCINIVGPTSIRPITNDQNTTLNVYPNPFNHQLTVNLNSATTQEAVIVLQTITGQEIINITKALEIGDNHLELPSNRLPQGMYLVNVYLADGTLLTKKVIRE
ncbi:S8 family serine peptidase [Aureispira anguillae]|uniref:S8 family serine peptidase n=1 Tax=Aureispira anguillae TaxID=2864201 RepID=A0A916DU56_9BACT|nr:S8 family serine peptidase [Aureispira anguillae]BDS13854.1 S8 family serine peptidase [Aureispira anguillae]